MSGTDRPERQQRTAAENVTFAVACSILLAVAAAIGVQATNPTEPAAPVATLTGDAYQQGERFYVVASVANQGDEAAVDIEVVAELTVDGEVTEAQATVDLLAGSEAKDVTFVFDEDPASGTVEVQVTGFSAH